MAARVRLARARTEPRLDPVRWRRPGAGLLIRLAVVAALLSLAALVAWSGPSGSGQPKSRAPCLAAPAPSVGSSAPPPPPTVADSLPAVPAGSVGVPVRLAEPTALALVQPGDRVDLIRVEDAGHGTTPVAAAALVLGVTGPDDPAAGGLLVALPPADAEKAVAAQGRGFAILIRPS